MKHEATPQKRLPHAQRHSPSAARPLGAAVDGAVTFAADPAIRRQDLAAVIVIGYGCLLLRDAKDEAAQAMAEPIIKFS
ncbi:hypothetical protein [Jannaschia seosinensis]|uniref:hypothetical protein n=1 Tax=Jannaschia seosinensis TaxID=313367 RepID=UPI001C9275A5|nr:hypothetical protein [Jannaschia seosinensis]